MNAQDVAQQLPDIAARMHRIAHLEHNWIRVADGDNLVGRWVPIEEVDPETGAKSVVRRTVPRGGIVPIDLMLDHDLEQLRIEDRAEVGFVPNLVPYLTHRYKLVEMDSRVILTYTVDVPPPDVAVDGPQRHLSIQLTVPGKVSQGDLSIVQDQLLAGLDGIVGVFLPGARLGVEVAASVRAGNPWPVVDGAMPLETRAQGWKTPVVFDFLMSHELEVSRQRPKRRVVLYGPDGHEL